MKYHLNFGRLSSAPAAPSVGKAFRLAVLGDFSGRANEGELTTGEALANRKPLRVDVDDLDAIVQRMQVQLHLPIGVDGGTVEVKIASMDDFHPDELYDNVEIFSELSGLRRRLQNSSTFAAAAGEVQSWLPSGRSSSPQPASARGAVIPSGELDDFARLLGKTTAPKTSATSVDELLKQIVGPHIVPSPDPQQETLLAAVDEALSSAMRSVLHHPDFQTAEALWRSVELLTRELETSTQLQIVLYDITAEEIAADLSRIDALEETGLYKLLVEQPSLDEHQGPLSALVGNYMFELSPAHAELLGRIGKVAAAGSAPFIAGVSTDCLQKRAADEEHPLIAASWDSLRRLPHANYLGLTVPRFMLRWPYGAKTEPIDPFQFEEITPQSGFDGILWGNGAILAGLLLGKTYVGQGFSGMRLGKVMTVDDMPVYYYTDAHGDQVALPCTEQPVSESVAAHVLAQNFMPILSIQGRPEIRLGSFGSLAGEELSGPWAPANFAPDTPAVSQPDGPAEPDVPTVEDLEAQAMAEAESDLDELLAGLDASPAAEREPPPTETEIVAAKDDASPTLADDDVARSGPDSSEGSSAEVSDAGKDEELDALLDSVLGEQSEPQSGDDDIDPDVAALLADL